MTSAGPQETLLLLLRGGWDRSAVDRIGWEALARTAVAHRVQCLLVDALRRGGHWEQMPPDVASRLQRAYRRVRTQNILRFEVLQDALEHLAVAGIPAAPLKGAALAEWIYPDDVGLRPMSDLDVLVPAAQAARAAETLQQAGYRRRSVEPTPGFDHEFRGVLEQRSEGPMTCLLELHWRLVDIHYIDRHVDYAALWERAQPETWRGRPAYRLAVEDWLLHVVGHSLYKHRAVDLLDLCDVDRLVRHRAPALDWDRLLEIGRGYHWLPGLAQILARAKALLGTPAPDEFLLQAAAYRPPWAERRLMALWFSPHLPDVAYPLFDWLTLPSLKARWRYAGAYVLPSAPYLRFCYPDSADRPLPVLYVRRVWDRVTGLLGSRPPRETEAGALMRSDQGHEQP